MRTTHLAFGTTSLLGVNSFALLSRTSFLPSIYASSSSGPLRNNVSWTSTFDPAGLLRNFCPVANEERTKAAFVTASPSILARSFVTSARQSTASTMGGDASKPGGGGNTQFPKGKSDDEWRAVLSPAQFKVLRQQGTEPAFTHEYGENTQAGVYTCAACDTPLYKSTTKFKSGCGWPAFFDAIPGAVTRKVDRTFGMKRIEIRCAACDSHLGHVFEGEGFNTPTDERHCVNGISLRFTEDDKTSKV